MTEKTAYLPRPKRNGKKGYIWAPTFRITGAAAPWGYKNDPENSEILLPIPEQLDILEQGKKLLEEYSYRDVALWISEYSDRPITHVGLYNRLKLEDKRKTYARNLKDLAKRYEQTLKKAEKYEKAALDKKVYTGVEGDEDTGEDSCATETCAD